MTAHLCIDFCWPGEIASRWCLPMRPACTFVYRCVFQFEGGFDSMHGSYMLCCPNALQWQWRLYVDLRWIVFLSNLTVLLFICVRYAVWGLDSMHRNYMFCCPNAPQWRWWLYVDLRWMHKTVPRWPWTTNRPYVCIAFCVLKIESIIDIRCRMKL